MGLLDIGAGFDGVLDAGFEILLGGHAVGFP